MNEYNFIKTEEEAYKCCVYFKKGDSHPPKDFNGHKLLFWLAESSFVYNIGDDDEFINNIENKLIGFNEYDKIPLRLKAYLCMAFMKSSKLDIDEAISVFKSKIYNEYVVGMSN